MPHGRQRAGLRLTVTDHASRHHIRVVEHCSGCVRERVAELAAFVDRTGGLRRRVARDTAGEAELAEQSPQTLRVHGDVRVPLAVGTLEVGVRDNGGSAVAGATDEHHVHVAGSDHPVEIRVHEVQSRRGPPMSEQARLHVFGSKTLTQQRVRHQIDLTDGQVVRRPPIRVESPELFRSQRPGHRRGRFGHAGTAPVSFDATVALARRRARPR